MHGTAAELLAVVLLVATLVVAVGRPFGISEAAAAVPAALLLVITGVVPAHAAADTVARIGPTVGFLAAILVFGHLCARAGVFDYLGGLAARASHGSPRRLLALVVAMAAGVTVVLTLDATVVLLTPVVLVTAARVGTEARPHAYACSRVANSGSLLLPVSNLTNLLAFGASGLSFGRFAATTALPWALVCVLEWATLRRFFRGDLASSRPVDRQQPPLTRPSYALTVLALTVAGFVLTSSAGVSPAWAAVAGCVALLVPELRHRSVDPLTLLREASPGFCLFVLALAVVVDAVTRHGLASGLAHLLPNGSGLVAILAIALLAAALANLVNNLPATLALTPLLAGHPAGVLAMLLGVNIGPNATYPGSLATLLWRRILPEDERPRAAQFHLLGATTAIPLLLVAGVALWLSLQLVGV